MHYINIISKAKSIEVYVLQMSQGLLQINQKYKESGIAY